MNLADYYTTAEASTELEREKHIIINWIRKKKFPGAVKQGWMWLIPKTEVKELKKQLGG